MPSEAPSLDALLERDLSKLDEEDLRLFYAYFDEMKDHVRKYLGRKARQFPGESAAAQSALFSLFCDAAWAEVPLTDVDEHGYPALWPLLLKYIERHCNKWNKYYRAHKRKGVEVSLARGDSSAAGIEPPDRRSPADDEAAVGAVLEALQTKLTPRQRRIADLTAAGQTLTQIAAQLQCSESLVTLEKRAIRRLLENG